MYKSGFKLAFCSDLWLSRLTNADEAWHRAKCFFQATGQQIQTQIHSHSFMILLRPDEAGQLKSATHFSIPLESSFACGGREVTEAVFCLLTPMWHHMASHSGHDSSDDFLMYSGGLGGWSLAEAESPAVIGRIGSHRKEIKYYGTLPSQWRPGFGGNHLCRWSRPQECKWEHSCPVPSNAGTALSEQHSKHSKAFHLSDPPQTTCHNSTWPHRAPLHPSMHSWCSAMTSAVRAQFFGIE